MIDEADRDGDGEVSQDEFLRIMKKTSLYWKCSNYKTENSEFKNLENISTLQTYVLYFLYFVFFSFISPYVFCAAVKERPSVFLIQYFFWIKVQKKSTSFINVQFKFYTLRRRRRGPRGMQSDIIGVAAVFVQLSTDRLSYVVIRGGEVFRGDLNLGEKCTAC